ncbi:DUF2599 domain-containing protein [Enterococcus gallinarum]|uniref:DUF2599 domain-containing protein n=1 Tax=Enterococcus TaxID=1350 RepID=UPI000CF2CE62|nr:MULTISPECIES: DUF2599 domain-containing protein [Enterococcus]PQE54920.1 hypothetical protein CUS05_12310 [Enterococcus faecalis]ROY85594.1 DUF2599 domain-containing protein [Enterococcus gallinarum]
MKVLKDVVLGVLFLGLSFSTVAYGEEANSKITLNSDIVVSNLTTVVSTDINKVTTENGDSAEIVANVNNLETLEIRMKIDNAESLEIDKDFNVIKIANSDEKLSFFDVVDEHGNNLNDKVITETVEGNNIIQTLNVSDVQGDVVATAYAKGAFSYSHYFNWSKWITRDKKKSLSISPKSSLTGGTSNPNYNAIRASDSWDRIVEKHGKDGNWSNTSGMKSQYICHYNWAKLKTPWNIEPWRKGNANAGNLCNP